MPSSRRDYQSSMYPECGSSHRSGSDGGSYTAQRNKDSHDGYSDYNRSRDSRHGDRGGRHTGDAYADKRDSRHDRFYDGSSSRSANSNRKNGSGRNSSHHSNNGPPGRSRSSSRNRSKSRSKSKSILERFLPADFRPSQADPEARHHRRRKEKECEGFDWTPGVVLALIGATALFSVEKSMIKRQKKDYVD
ncbi:hypothetical protein V8C37DRAFT_225606 [Trichoderma ceciliae]